MVVGYKIQGETKICTFNHCMYANLMVLCVSLILVYVCKKLF